MLDADRIGFRDLRIDDLHLMHKWLNFELVIQWYEQRRFSLPEIEGKFIPRIRGEKPVSCYLILYGDNPIGYIQSYKISDFPDYAKHVAIGENASGIDLFIGEPDYIHKGLGYYIISKFLKNKVFVLTDSESCIIGPDPNNIIAIKAYQKVGFKYIKTVVIPEEDEIEYIMKISKDGILKR
jgi:aminoglycoside 6'-N-acetyltransferase